jgi:L-amino acid N-acyltransferase YncA
LVFDLETLIVALDSIRLREAHDADVPALARLHVATFNETHGPGPSYETRLRQWAEKFSQSDAFMFCVLLEVDSETLAGFASGERYSQEDMPAYRGELNKIYLLRAYQRRGLGRLLLRAAALRFLERGVDSMVLFGDARSPSNGFYEAMGGTRLYSPAGEFHGGYGWTDLRVLSSSELRGQPTDLGTA